MTTQDRRREPREILGPLAALTVCVFLWSAVLTFDVGDWPSPNQFPHNAPVANKCGVVGAFCAFQLRYGLGDGAYPLLLFATMASLVKLVRGRVGQWRERCFGLTLVVLCTGASVHLIAPPDADSLIVGHGGVIGYAVGDYLRENLSALGTGIMIVSSLFVGLLFVTEGWILELPGAIKKVGAATGAAVAIARDTALRPVPRLVPAGGRLPDDPVIDVNAGKLRRAKQRRRAAKRLTHEHPVVHEPEEDEFMDDAAAGDDDAAVATVDDDSDTAGAEEQRQAARTAPDGRAARAARDVIVNMPSADKLAAAEPYPRQIENWTLPSLSLLHQPEFGFDKKQEGVVREQARILERTLEEFRIDARVVEIDTGPVITMFELNIGAGVKVSQIASLSNDIARALKAHAVRVVAPISGKNTIGIEVPNVTKEAVRLKELITLAGKRAADMGLPLFLGKDASGAALVADLAKMPHLLIAGTTGSGKSVCLNAIVISLLMMKRPDHVKMILVDPKMVEMSHFKDVPHLMCPIITDVPRAEKILAWAVTKMDERYELLAEARVRNITGYNALSQEELYDRFQPADDSEKARIATHIPYIVIVIDELADLMMTSAKEVEHHLSRLAQKSRAVGIHIIVATQRPEAKIVTGLIKSNLPCRIAFRVASRMDSRIVLDQNGGEVLMGQGDMLFLPPGSHKLIRAQGTYLDDDEMHAVLDDLASRAKPEFHPELVRLKTGAGGGDGEMRDPLFDKAVRTVLTSKRGSVSLLQRRLTIGYSRASRLIEQMADAGIVGAHKGSQARGVTMTVEEWDALQKQVAADMDSGYAADEAAGSTGDDD